jgi:hypothetical protein
LLIKNVSCHVEANAFFLSSYGDDNCAYKITNLTASIYNGEISKIIKDKLYWSIALAGIIFSMAGYFLLVSQCIKEKERDRKIFLQLIILYLGINFLVMLPLSVEKFSDLRYLTPVFFVPFLFLGLVAKVIYEKFSKKYIVIGIFFLLAYSNVIAISSQAKPLIDKNRTCSSHYTTMGEIEAVASYIGANIDAGKSVLVGGNKELSVAVEPLRYLLEKQKVASVIIKNESDVIPDGKPAFFMSCRSKMKEQYVYQKVGNIYVYKMNNSSNK